MRGISIATRSGLSRAHTAIGMIEPRKAVKLGARIAALVCPCRADKRFARGGPRPLCSGGPRRPAPWVRGGEDRRKPPSSSGLGHSPFKAAARVRIPLGALLAGPAGGTHGPVEQLGVLATLSRWRSRVQIDRKSVV